jgi:hypothetical protein
MRLIVPFAAVIDAICIRPAAATIKLVMHWEMVTNR